MVVTKQELDRWAQQRELILLPEIMHDTWRQAGLTPPPDEITAILENPLTCGTGLLKLAQDRTIKVQHHLNQQECSTLYDETRHNLRMHNLLGANQQARKSYKHIGDLKELIEMLEHTLVSDTLCDDETLEEKKDFVQRVKTVAQQTVNQAITSALQCGYRMALHDCNIQNSFHVEKSFNDRVIRPQKGGQAKATGFNLIRGLVQKMGQDLITHFSHAKLKKKDIEEAVAKHLAAYAKKDARKEKPEFIHFVGRVPALKTIKNWLMEIKIPTPTDDAQEINIQQLSQQLKNTYPDKVISEMLK